MQIDFGVPLRRGIYIPLALLACLTPATHAVAFQTGTKPAESEQADSEESAEPKTSDEATEPEEMTKSVKDQILQLQTEFETEYAKQSPLTMPPRMTTKKKRFCSLARVQFTYQSSLNSMKRILMTETQSKPFIKR